MRVDILKNKGYNKYLVFHSSNENEELIKMMFLMELKTKSKK